MKSKPLTTNVAREERIKREIVADCYDEYEARSGWHCYLEDTLAFPFEAKCIVPPVLAAFRQTGHRNREPDGRAPFFWESRLPFQSL